MKKWIFSVAMAVLLALTAFGFAACDEPSGNGGNGGEGVVPTYQGMTIVSSAEGGAKLRFLVQARSNDNGNKGNGNNGHDPWEDRPGWRPGDGNPHGDYDTDEDDPPAEDIEDIVNIDVIEDDEVKYYVSPGETFIVQIHLSNPDQYEIQSFTLNGHRYANYMFMEGSTMELLLLQVTAPVVPGYTEYTLDAIKYIDGTEIKDVRLEGDKTIKAGVAYTAEPSAVVTDSRIGTTNASLRIELTDEEGALDGAPVTFWLSDGEKSVYSRELSLGSNTIELESLVMGKTYEYGVATYYDKIDGTGVQERWLLTDTFTTLKAFAITDASIYQSQVEFTVTKTGSSGEITAIELIDMVDGSIVDSLTDFTQTWFVGLLSNHGYKIRVSFTYELNGQSVADSTAITFTTGSKTVPALALEGVAATQDEITFAVATDDVDGILSIDIIELLLNGQSVQRLEDVTMRQFSGLLSDTEYTLLVNYSYDLNDGTGIQRRTEKVDVTTLAKTAPTVTVVDTVATQESISFGLATEDADGLLTVDKIELLLDGEVVQTLENLESYEFKDLLSDNEYTIRVTYLYDLNDGEGVQTKTAESVIKTLAKTAPTVAVVDTVATQESISFGLATEDADGLLTVDKIELLLDGEVVQTLENLESYEFKDLLSDNEYTIRVTYLYDLNDGEGAQTKTTESVIKTLAKAEPEIEAEFDNVTGNAASGTVRIKDKDGIGFVVSVSLYNGEDFLYDILNYSEFSLTELEFYTEYTVKVVYRFDLNDGSGAQEKTSEFAFTTVPYFAFIDCKIINTEAVSEGENIVLRANIENPTGATFTAVTVNGVEYAVNTISTPTYLYVEIPNEGQFLGGETLLAVEKVVVTLDGVQYTILPNGNNSDTVFINGALYVDEVAIADDSYEAVNFGYIGAQHYVQLTLRNPTGYEVYSVTMNTNWSDVTVTEGIIRLGANICLVPVELNVGTNNILVKSLKYRNSSLDREINFDLSTSVFGTENKNAVPVSTYEDLLNMDDGKYYELINDIDLEGRQWNGGNFSGVFEGNEFTIRNMSVVTTLDGSEIYLGLFDKGSGVIQNLTIENATYIVDIVRENASVYFGGFVAYGESRLTLENCHFVDSMVSLTTDLFISNPAVGGLVGGASSLLIMNCSNTSNITNKLQAGSTGGLVGSGYLNGELLIQSSFNSGNVTGNHGNTGGLIGEYGKVEKSYNIGTVSGYSWVGGLVGYDGIISYSYNRGNVTGDNTIGGLGGTISLITDSYNMGFVCGKDRVGGLCGSIMSTGRIIGSYNIGKVIGDSNVGGLSGECYYGNICESYNEGTIEGNGTRIGGLLGYCEKEIIMNNCYNIGTVSGVAEIGGLIGEGNMDYGYISGCYNEGNISGNIKIGGLYGTNGIAINCSNKGSITGRGEIGGLIGFKGIVKGCCNYGNIVGDVEKTGGLIGCNGTIIDSYNSGKITGKDFVGGLAGDTATIENSFNEGDIIGSNYVGGILGSNGTIVNSCNVGEVSGVSNVGGLVGSNDNTAAVDKQTSFIVPDTVTAIGSNAFMNRTELEMVFIPETVLTIGKNAFYGCENLLIFVQATEQPAGWEKDWNAGRPVVWGYTEGETFVYRFESNGGTEFADVQGFILEELPVPQREGYIFGGWYDTPDFSGERIRGVYYKQGGATLYAKWYRLNGMQSEGLEIVDGVIVGIGTCTDSVVYIAMPVAERAFIGCDTITKVIFSDGASLANNAFGDSGTGCPNLREVYFVGEEFPEIGDDVFGSTWNYSDFAVYVPAELYEDFASVSDGYWQDYIVNGGKLHTLDEAEMIG